MALTRTYIKGKLPLLDDTKGDDHYQVAVDRRLVELIVFLHRFRREQEVQKGATYYILAAGLDTDAEGRTVGDVLEKGIIVGFAADDGIATTIEMMSGVFARVRPELLEIADNALKLKAPAWTTGLLIADGSMQSHNGSGDGVSSGETSQPGQS